MVIHTKVKGNFMSSILPDLRSEYYVGMIPTTDLPSKRKQLCPLNANVFLFAEKGEKEYKINSP